MTAAGSRLAAAAAGLDLRPESSLEAHDLFGGTPLSEQARRSVGKSLTLVCTKFPVLASLGGLWEVLRPGPGSEVNWQGLVSVKASVSLK